jgi:hypothetical protein
MWVMLARSRGLIYAIIWALLTVQNAALVHANEHRLNIDWQHSNEDSTCQVYFAAERLGHGLSTVPVPCVPYVGTPLWHLVPLQIFYPLVIPAFHARAPPFI